MAKEIVKFDAEQKEVLLQKINGCKAAMQDENKVVYSWFVDL